MKLLSLLALLIISPNILAIDIWEQRADFGSIGRHRGTGVGIGNKAYAGMGHQNGNGVDIWFADWWEYDPSTNSWTQKANYPGNNGNGDQDVTAINIGNVGYIGLGQLAGNSFYKYDPMVNLWTPVASPPVGNTFSNQSPFRIGTKGYYPVLFSNKFFQYDAQTDSWTQLGNLPFSTIYGIPTFAIGTKGYIKNGADFYAYDPGTDTWSPKAPFPGLYPNRPIGVAQSNYGFFIGGFQGNPLTLPWDWSPNVWRYDPLNDSWLQMPDFPGSTRRWTVAMNVNDRVYYGLGTNGINFNDFWEFTSNAGIEDKPEDNFQVFPNPANDFIEFHSKDQQEFEVEISNAMGEVISSLKSVNGLVRLERGELPFGLYWANIHHEELHSISKRFVFL